MKAVCKGVITVEASIVVTFAIYTILFILTVSMYFFDNNVINNVAITSALKCQNKFECSKESKDKIIKNIEKDIKIKIVGESMCLNDAKVKIDIGYMDISLDIETTFKGVVYPFKNLKIDKKIKIAHITPSKDLRKGKEVKEFIGSK